MAFRLSYKLVGFCLALALCGCSPYLYVPNPTNVPLPYSKNEIKASGSLSSAGLCFQGSYALTNKIVLSGTYIGLNGNPDSTNLRGINQFGAIGIGYYKTWKGFRFEALGGFGIGNSYVNCNVKNPSFGVSGGQTGYSVNNNYSSSTIQLDGGIFGKYIEAGISLKLNYLGMYNEWYYIYDLSNDGKTIFDEQSLQLPSNVFLFEPAYFFSVGLKHVKFILSTGASIVLGPQSKYWNDKNLNEGGFLSEGIIIDLFRESKEKKVLK